MTQSVVTALLDEIERVAGMRARWKGHARESGVQGPAALTLLLMTAAINAGKKAIAEDDAVIAILALQDLRGFDADE